jgi:Alpha/beta hydrolase domain
MAGLVPVNSGQHHVVAKAALHHLVAWITGGDAPPKADRLAARPGTPITFERDEHGNALGGVRTPAVEAPVATLTGEAEGDGFCRLLGETIPFRPEQLAALYPTHDAFVAAVTEAAEAAVADGFVLGPDADALVAEAEASAIRTRARVRAPARRATPSGWRPRCSPPRRRRRPRAPRHPAAAARPRAARRAAPRWR